ncbi:MAG: NAD(P)/FAD-dependent oxidoreductase [Planctomycetaceae bacterium]
MRVRSVGIVGGGPGGLMTAYLLEKYAAAPLRITLLEASDRLGGKVLTPAFQTAPVRYEAGAAEFYDYEGLGEDPLKDLIRELGLSIAPMGGSAVILDEQVISSLEDVEHYLGPGAGRALLEFDQQARDCIVPDEFYHSDDPEGSPDVAEPVSFRESLARIANPAARRYVETLIHSDLAAEPSQTSFDYGLQNYLMNDGRYMKLYGIVGGNEQLPQALAARINAEVRLGVRVRSIRSTGDQLAVTTERGESQVVEHFDIVVAALPHQLLGQVAFEGPRLATAIANHLAHYDHPAHYLRITLLFERPFWRSMLTDSYWMLDKWGGCCLYDESARQPGTTHGVLGWLLAGDAAVAARDQSDQELIAAALDSLPGPLAAGRNCCLEGRVHRWSCEVNAIPGGRFRQRLDRRHQPEPLEHPGLFVVGDYLFDSTINGVYDSAEYVASWIAAATCAPVEQPVLV